MTTLATQPSLAPLALGAPSDRSLRLVLITACVLSALLGRSCFLARPFDNDAAIFIYMGKMVANGGRLCHDLIDNKFPTVGLMTSIVWRLFGTCWPAYVALQTALSFAAAWSLGRTAGRVAGPSARLPVTLFMLVFLDFTTAVFGGFQLETVQVFFSTIAAGAIIKLLDGDKKSTGLAAFTAGLATGCAMMLKPTGIAVLLAALFALAMRRTRDGYSFKHSAKLYAQLGLGLAVPASGVLLYLTEARLLGDMPALYGQISTYAHESVFDAVELIKPLTALLFLGFPLFVRGVIFRRHRDLSVPAPASGLLPFCVLWLLIETAGVILQRRMYAYHFLPMVPPAALLFGLIPRLNRPGMLAAALLPIALLSTRQAFNLIATTRPGESPMPVSQYLITHAKPGDAVWMDAWPRVVLETGLTPASRLPFTFLFTNYDQAGIDYSAGIIADFERIKPAYVVLPVPLERRMQNQIDFIPELNRMPVRQANYVAGWRRIERYTLGHYTKETMIGNDAIYHRRP